MKKITFTSLVLLHATIYTVLGQDKKAAAEQKAIVNLLDQKKDHYADVAHKIWEFAEVGFQEYKSSELLQEELKKEGFTVQNGVAGIPTAFVASYGSGKPVISILAEFDALPGMAQEAVAERKIIEGQKAGHACGHHLFGTGSSAAAIAVKDWLKKSGQSGTVKLMGCPAEEGGSGKVYMVREGAFNDSDIVLHWHPSDRNSANSMSSLANISGKIRFKGVSAHAAGAPERGRSALDGVEAMNNMVNMMREHVPQETRIHYVITRGGEAPNVVPAFAEVYYYARHPKREVLRDVWSRILDAAKGAALGTGTTVEVEITGGAYDILPIQSLAKIMNKNLEAVGGVKYSESEVAFAEKMNPTLRVEGKETPTYIQADQLTRYTDEPDPLGGSTDVGNVSWAVPTVGLTVATWVPGTPMHSWQAVAAGGMSVGAKGMMVAAKTLALTAIDLIKNPVLIKEAQTEWQKARGTNFKYNAMVGDRKPALDYRK